VLDFMGIQRGEIMPERKLEQKIIDNLERFLLEIGKGFAFLGRQSKISISGKHFYLDLVFYHVVLKCYVIIDLKKGSFSHENAGQMLMYVNYYDSEIKQESDNPTIGIILCAEKDKNIVEFTLKNNNQIFATQYLTYLPTKDELME
jgi:YhcG PDDEXK nuclease domain